MSVQPDGVKGQRVLVVGASNGIGAALACRLAEQGAAVVAAARQVDRLRELPGTTPIRCDVTVPGDVESLVADTTEVLGGLDAIVYATGFGRLMTLDRVEPEDWVESFSTNLYGAAALTKAALPHLLAEGSQGRAMFLTSDSSDNPFPGLVVYGASKAALRAFTRGLANEFGSLRISEILVGPTLGTAFADQFDGALLEELLPRWIEQRYVQREMLQPDDVAAIIIGVLAAEHPPVQVLAMGADVPPADGDTDGTAP